MSLIEQLKESGDDRTADLMVEMWGDWDRDGEWDPITHLRSLDKRGDATLGYMEFFPNDGSGRVEREAAEFEDGSRVIFLSGTWNPIAVPESGKLEGGEFGRFTPAS